MKIIALAVILHTVFLGIVQATIDKCDVCLKIATLAKKCGDDYEETTKAKAMKEVDEYNDEEKEFFKNELNCHWEKYYADANSPTIAGTNPRSTCADTACCPASDQIANFTTVDLTNTNKNFSKDRCVVPKIILLHHTVTKTIEETLHVMQQVPVSAQYIVARNGTIYQLFNDAVRAWHAGAGTFMEVGDVNTHSVGIEIVNYGDEPFDTEQIKSVKLLVDTLRLRWRIRDNYVIGHMEISPDRKQDPSGYFPWSDLNDHLGIFPKLYQTNMSPDDMKTVLINNSTGTADEIKTLQDDLKNWGYTYLAMQPGVLDRNTTFNILAFNRRYAPEVFVKETIANDNMILNPLNNQWYQVSQERLLRLLNLLPLLK